MFGTQFAPCFVLGWFLRGNVVLYMATETFMSPVALMLIPTFVWVGELILQVEEPFDASTLVSGLQEDLFGTLKSAQFALLRGVAGWTALCPVLLAIVYFVSLPIMSRIIPTSASDSVAL